MDIALVTPRFRPAIGGVEMHVEKIATGMTRGGHDVEILTQAPHSAGLPPIEQMDGGLLRRFTTVTNSRHYAFAPGLASYLARHSGRYDLVHAHNYHALPALIAAETTRGPFVLTPHYHGVSESSTRNLLHRPYRVAGSRMARRASAVISVSASEASLFAHHFPQAANKVSIIPNGVDMLEIDAAQPFKCTDRSVVLSAGRLENYKRIDLIVRALRHLDARFVLYVAGEGLARQSLENLASDLGLADRVILLGRLERTDLNRWFRTADVYVSMSTIEAMGIASLEALYAGAAVVASDIPAHRDSAKLGGSRFNLVEQGASPSEIAAAVAAASARGQAHDHSIPSWEQVLEQTERAYDWAISRTSEGL